MATEDKKNHKSSTPVKSTPEHKNKTEPNKKIRLFSQVSINVPIPRELVMILPSLSLNDSNDQSTESSPHSDRAENYIPADSNEQITAQNTVRDKKNNQLDTAPEVETVVQADEHSEHRGAIPHSSHHLSTKLHPVVHHLIGQTPDLKMPTAPSTNIPASHTQTTTTPPPIIYVDETIKGKYGTLNIDVTGTYTFTLDPKSPAFILLQKKEPGTDTFTVHLSNGSTAVIHIPVQGKQDTPSVSGDLQGLVTEDHNVDAAGLISTSGKIDVIDPDHGESSIQAEKLQGQFGTLTIDSKGQWQYQVKNSQSNIQALTQKTALHESFTIHTKDGTPQVLNMTIGGEDDNASISGKNGQVTEDAQLTASGKLSINDPDANQAHFSNTDIVSAFGTLHLKDDGTWTYDLDNTNPKVQALGQGATATDPVTVTSADGTQHQIIITINGSNDLPEVSGTSSGLAVEQGLNAAGIPDASGSLTASDKDTSDTISWAVSQPQGQFGSLSIDQQGHWHYQLDNSPGSATDKLAAGEHQSESFWITATDSAGATVPHKIIIDVQGSNDKPIVSAWTQLPAGKEDQPVTIKASDLLTHASDVDSSDVLHVTNLQATHGSLTDNKDGTYTFTPDKDFNGEVRLTYDVVDGHGGSVSTQAKFDLIATPDNAIITDAQTDADLRGVTEDRGYIDTYYQLHYDGRLNIQDPDAGEAQFDPNIGPQTYQGIGYDTKLGGHIVLMRDGHYTYTLDNRNIQDLAQGEVKHDSAIIRSVDGTTHTIELTVHGTNDAPVINAQSHSVTEGGNVLHGQMVGHDIDTGATLTYSAPQVDGLVVNPDGSYSFNPAHSTYQSLASGISKTLTVPVTVTDEHNASSTQNLSITITGVNNSAVIGGVNTGDVTEGNAGQNMSPDYAQPGMAKLGQAALTADGKLDIVDPDSGESQFDTKGGAWNNSYHGKYGHLLLNSDGTWHYHASAGSVDWVGNQKTTVGTTIDQLGENQTLTDTITVYSKDGTSHDIIITIHGSNDRPYCASEVQLNSGKEDSTQTITATELLANTVDVDTNDVGKLTIANLHADHGSIKDNQDGTYTFTPDKDYNGQVHFTYDVKDDHSGVTHTGANMVLSPTGDAATFSGTDTGNLTEDLHVQGDAQHTIYTTGVLDVTDPDSGEDHFRATRNAHALHDPYGGTLTIGTAGDWSYSVPNGNVQHLAQGESKQVQYEVQSAGGDKHVITLTIHGTNDAPIVTSAVTLAQGTEDTPVTLKASVLLANATDVDDNSHLSIHNLSVDHGQIVDNHDGTFSFTPDRNYNGQVQFHYEIQDEHGASVSTSASMNLAAINDAATLPTSQAANSVTEDHLKSGTHSSELWSGWKNLDIQDIDSPSEAKVTQIEFNGVKHTVPADFAMNLAGAHGTFNFTHSTDGHNKWSYSADNSHTEVQGLSNGESLTDAITLITADGTRIPLTAKILGTDDHVVIDTPDALTAALGTAVEDKVTSISGTLLAHDSDSKDSVTFTAGDSIGAYGTLHVDSNGQWHYDLDHSKANALQQGETKAEGFDITATSTDGSTATKHIEVLVQGSNDQATITVVSNPDVHEDGSSTPVEVISGKLSATDPDHDQSAFSADVGKRHDPFNSGVHGGLHISKDGSWTYSVNNSQIQQLAAGREEHVLYNVHTVGGDTHVIDIKIVGTNDVPVLSVTQTTPTTGTLTETDLDTNDTHTFSVVSSTGQFGSLSVDPDTGAYVYTANGSVAGMSYNAATQTYHGIDVFEVKVVDNHGGESTRFVTFDTNGQVSVIPGQQPIISTSVPVNPLITATQPSLPVGTNTPPSNTVTVDLATPSDTGASNTDNLTKDNSPTITGQTDIPYSQVTIYEGSKPIGHTVSDGTGHYSVAVSSLTDGNHNLSAEALAPPATVPATSSLLSVHVDTTILPLQVSLTQDTGSNTSDLITSDGSLTITGQEAGATIEYSMDNGRTWTSSFTPQQGSNTVSVRQTDTAGNVSASSSLTFTLDNSSPAPTVTLATDSGNSSSDNITNVGDLSIGGVEQGATVEYSIDNGVHWSTQFTPNEGVNNVQVRQTDVAGNVSPSTSLTYTLDTQTDIRVNSVQVDQNGKGMMVQVYFPNDSEVTLLEITSDGGGSPLLVDLSTVQRLSASSSVKHPDHQYQEFVGIDLSSLPDGNLTIRVAGTDKAGNTVTAQTPAGVNYVLDTSASATDDTNTAVEDVTTHLSGNVLTNDLDADVVTSTGDIQGQYGLFHLNSDGSYTYTLNNSLPAIQQLNSGSTPLIDTITYTAQDSAGNQASAHLQISIQGTDDNHVPTVTGQTITLDEDTTRTLATSDFGYSDADHDTLNHITITQLPAHGTLMLNGVLVTSNQQISKADLDAGHLTFTPIHDQNGANYANIGFTANDGHQDSASATMILNVNAINDDPAVGSSFKSSHEDTPLHFTKSDFKYLDVDGDAMHHITVTNIAHGTLSLNGHSVSVGDDIPAVDISSLVFTPSPNYSSAGLNGLAAVQFTANDGHVDSKEGSIFINIAPVDDPATFKGDSQGGVQEDSHTQATGTLTASDPDGTQGFIEVQGGVGIVGSKGYGHAHIDNNGHWTYNLYNNNAIVQQLKQGQTETETETITVQAKDGTTHDITITITGTNDIPTVSEHAPGSSHSVTEDTNSNASGRLDISDIDGDVVSVTVDPSHNAQFGQVQFDSHTNTWTYHLNNTNPKVDALNDGDTLQDTFTLLVDDGHGGQTSQQITMTINGHTDPVPYTPPTIRVNVDAQHAHHITPSITATTVQTYAHSIGQYAQRVSGRDEIEGHGNSEVFIVQGSLHEEAELKGGNDILFIGGRLTDEEIEGGSGTDTLILGAYTRQNAPRLHDHGEKLGNMELESIENIILGDGTVLKGRMPANFPVSSHGHYETAVDISAHLSSPDESVTDIRLTHLQSGVTLQSNGHPIHANPDGSYSVPSNGHITLVSPQPINGNHHYFETEVTTHNSVTGVTAVTSEDLHGQTHSHITPPPPPALSQSDEIGDVDTLDVDITLSTTEDEQHHASQHTSHQASHADTSGSPHGAAAYLTALGIEPTQVVSDTSDQAALPDDIDIVFADTQNPVDTPHLASDITEGVLREGDNQHEGDHQDDKHEELINPDEHHDQGDPSSFIDPY